MVNSKEFVCNLAKKGFVSEIMSDIRDVILKIEVAEQFIGDMKHITELARMSESLELRAKGGLLALEQECGKMRDDGVLAVVSVTSEINERSQRLLDKAERI